MRRELLKARLKFFRLFLNLRVSGVRHPSFPPPEPTQPENRIAIFFEIIITLVSLPNRNDSTLLHEVIYMIPDCPACQSRTSTLATMVKQIGGSIWGCRRYRQRFSAWRYKRGNTGGPCRATLMRPSAGRRRRLVQFIGAVSGGIMAVSQVLKTRCPCFDKDLFLQSRLRGSAATHF